MARIFDLRPRVAVVGLMCLLVTVAAWVLSAGEAKRPELSKISEAALLKPTGFAQLISVDPLPAMDGAMCQWMPASATLAATSHSAMSRDTYPPTDEASRLGYKLRSLCRIPFFRSTKARVSKSGGRL